MTGLTLLTWIVGLAFLAFCVWLAITWTEEPSADPLFLDAMERAADHDARMDARAAERGWVRS